MSTLKSDYKQSPATEQIAVAKLDKSPLNARKTVSKAACEELKASILAHGLIQNLVVVKSKPTEFREGIEYRVIAGARRLAALRALQKEGHLPADHAVPCQVVTEEQALEMSIAENVIREAMHPADEFEAFTALSDLGHSAEQIAQRFGTDEKHVLQRLKLGRVAPELLKEYRAGKIKLETLMAFTITDDRKRQVKVFKSLEGWQKDNPRHIRECLTDKMVSSKDHVARFVGLDAYTAAGGTSKTDLFGEDVYLEDATLLNRLAGEKLETVAAQLRKEGWSWVEVNAKRDWDFVNRCEELEPRPIDAPKKLLDRLAKAKAEEKRLDDTIDATEDDDELDRLYDKQHEAEAKRESIEEELESYAKFDEEQKKVAGCYVYIGHNGAVEVDKGLVRPEDKRAAAKVNGADASIEDDDQSAEKPKGLSESLKRDLEAYRLGVAQAQIAKHPAIAFDLLVFRAAKSVLTVRSSFDGPEVSFSRNFAGTASVEARGFVKAQIELIAKALPTGWLEAETEAEQFLAFQQLSDYQKESLLAYSVAVSLQPKLDDGREPIAYDVALAQTGANVAGYWRPTKENFLSRVTKDQLLEIGRELIGGDSGDRWASINTDKKKGDIAGELHKAFAEPDRPGMTAEQLDRLKNWLPKGMAFLAAPEPKPAKAKKSKKAA